jgi:hypothetical protein
MNCWCFDLVLLFGFGFGPWGLDEEGDMVVVVAAAGSATKRWPLGVAGPPPRAIPNDPKKKIIILLFLFLKRLVIKY